MDYPNLYQTIHQRIPATLDIAVHCLLVVLTMRTNRFVRLASPKEAYQRICSRNSVKWYQKLNWRYSFESVTQDTCPFIKVVILFSCV